MYSVVSSHGESDPKVTDLRYQYMEERWREREGSIFLKHVTPLKGEGRLFDNFVVSTTTECIRNSRVFLVEDSAYSAYYASARIFRPSFRKNNPKKHVSLI